MLLALASIILQTLPSLYAIPVDRSDIADSVSPFIQHAVAKSSDIPKAQLIYDERKETSTNPAPDVGGINISDDDADKFGADFDVVVVVNKAADVQRLTIYRYKSVYCDDPSVANLDKCKNNPDGTAKRLPKSKESFKVSTGREVWKCEQKVDRDQSDNGDREARWLGTPTGYYTPFSIQADHISKTYDDAHMRFASFFNKLGIAFHKPDVTPLPPPPEPTGDAAKDARATKKWNTLQSKYNDAVAVALRSRQSHGCIRIEEADKIQQAIIESGPMPDEKFNNNYYDGNRAKTPAAQKVVQDAIDAGEADDSGGGPYSPAPTIPDLNVATGQPNLDTAGKAKRKAGYRSLVIIECIDKKGRDCSTSKSYLANNKPTCEQNQKVEPPEQTTNPFDGIANFFKGLGG